MNDLSVYMITKNEEARLVRTLTAAREIADEIVIVDSGSIDRTVAIARSFDAKVFIREWDNYSAQKAFAESKCTGSWLLNLDADEELSPDLIEEIPLSLTSEKYDAYRIKIADIFPGHPRPHPWVKKNCVLRLYRRGCAAMENTFSWDRVRLLRADVRIGTLRSDIWHHSFESISKTVEKYNAYSDALLQGSLAEEKKYSPWRIPLAMTGNFLRYFILHRQFLYGFWGYINSVNGAWLRFLKFSKHYEYNQKISENPYPSSSGDKKLSERL